MDTKELLELYKSLFETWRFEVNSHWQRSSYFAAFETVAVAACWKLLNDQFAPRWAAPTLAILGMVLTVVWFLNNRKTHFYAVFWLDKVGVIENKLVGKGEEGIDFVTQILNRPRGVIRHRQLVQAVPVIFFVAWTILLRFSLSGCSMLQSRAMHLITYESATLVVALASFLASVAAAWIARGSLSQSKRVADRDQKDWKQRRWFDLYFKADEAYDALERFQALFPSTSSPNWNTAEMQREFNHLMLTMRTVHRIAIVFPQNPLIQALFNATAVFKDADEATSKDRLSQIFDAVEGIRQKALVDQGILD